MDKILQLYQIPGVGLKKAWEIVNLGDSFIDKFINSYPDSVIHKSLESVKVIKENCNKWDVKIVRVRKSLFKGSPLLLFLKGDESLMFNNLKLGVIGSRQPSIEYLDQSKEYILHALNRGFITISGFAIGCDQFAHNLTLEESKPTIAILPRGYNKNLDSLIADKGLIVSEYPPETPVYKYRCVRRNRLISGFSDGLFVIDAKEGSGSNHAVKDYVEGKRDFAFINFQNEKFSQYGTKIKNLNEFDLYLEKCIEYSNEKITNSSFFKLPF